MSERRSRMVLVIGGGPAGLGAALGARRAGAAEVLVLERFPDPGLLRRGETLRYDAEAEALLYPGFFDRHTRHRVDRRCYFSPSGKKSVERRIANPNRIISWPDLIDDLARLVQSRGATLLRDAQAVALELEDDGVRHVRWRDQHGREHSSEVAFAVAADGHDGLCTRLLGQDRRDIDFPVLKTLRRAVDVAQDRLEYHLHVEESGRAMVGCIFPRGDDEAEVLIMGWDPPQAAVAAAAALPTARHGLRLALRSFAGQHPLFASRLEGSEVLYTHESAVPMGGLLEPACPLPRLILAGDLAGQVQARGGSGIVSSLVLGHFAGELAGAAAVRGGHLGPLDRLALNAAVQEHPAQQRLRSMQRLLGWPRQHLFALLGSPAAFDRFWLWLSLLLR
ncbi:MAG: FAD-dependent oxidoreductase [Deltaproteobacteria bacterium]|nr:FAD-dependent oxidoreductase [Deltaproteobacteria bacterium]